MKKLLCATFAVLVLAGCSGGAKTETKTCSMEQSGMKMDESESPRRESPGDQSPTIEDDKITKTSVKVTMDLSAAGLGDTELTDDQKKQLETAVLSPLGVEEGKGVNVSAEFKDKNIIATVDVDMKDGDSATLKKLGFGGEASLSKTLEEAKDGGATCK